MLKKQGMMILMLMMVFMIYCASHETLNSIVTYLGSGGGSCFVQQYINLDSFEVTVALCLRLNSVITGITSLGTPVKYKYNKQQHP